MCTLKPIIAHSYRFCFSSKTDTPPHSSVAATVDHPKLKTYIKILTKIDTTITTVIVGARQDLTQMVMVHHRLAGRQLSGGDKGETLRRPSTMLRVHSTATLISCV